MAIKNDDPAFEAGYQFVRSNSEAPDIPHGSAPWWYGWVIREAFWAGIEWERKRLVEITGCIPAIDEEGRDFLEKCIARLGCPGLGNIKQE